MKLKNKTLAWVYARIRRYIPAILSLSILSALVSVSLILLALVSKAVLDSATGDAAYKLSLCGIYLLGIVLLQMLLNAFISVITVRVSGKMTISLRDYLFSSLVKKKYGSISAHHSGDLLNRFTSDIDVIVSAATGIIPNAISMVAKIIAGIAALVILSPAIAVIVLVLGFTVPFLGRFISKKYKYMHKECQRTEGQARSFLQESFANIVVIKTFVSELPILNKLNEYMRENLRLKIKRNFVSVVISTLLYFFFTAGYYILLLWGAGAIAAGAITYGTLTAFLQLVSQLRAPLQNISGIIPQYYSAIASAERLIELEEIENEPALLDSSDLTELKNSFRRICIDHLAFAYENEMILKNCTFNVEKNCITAITGESGSGKSTLFKILLGLYEPSGGSITFNGTLPVSPATRGMFAYVPQGNMILSGTIRDNITLCNEAITDKQVERAAKAAVIYDYILSLPDGFNTVLSERGAGLSEGQVQRISIARALLYDTPILLLDEATSALDEQTETALLSNIKQMSDKTILFITHRSTSISVCDHIIHVEQKKFSVIK